MDPGPHIETSYAELEALCSIALAAKGEERLELFLLVRDLADALAAKLIYETAHGEERFGLAYANLAHNYGSALMAARGMLWRIATKNFRRFNGAPDMTVEECQAVLVRCEGVLVQNGTVILRLLRDSGAKRE